MAEWWEWTGEPGPWESNAAPTMDWGGVGADYSSGYDAPIGPGLGWDAGGYPTGAAGSGLSLEQQVAQAIAQRPDLYGSSVSEGAGGGSSFWGSLGKLLLGGGQAAAGAVGGGGGGILGPLLSSLGSIGGGAIGSNAANEAARLQSQALNRGIDLQTAQWLQQQGNLAPYLQAGQQGLSTLQGLAGREQPALPGPSSQVNRQWYDYSLPGATPSWTPQSYQGPQNVNAQDFAYTPGQGPQASQYGYQGPQSVMAGDYRWTPGQGPQAQDYRYTPGNIPSAAANRWTPGQGPSAADYRYAPGQTPDAANYRYTPGAVPTLSGRELLANDPGVQFRLDEGRRALESSAAARGGLLSGPTLAALQRQGQELSSQEYGNAWQRAAQQAQMREGWQQTATAQNFGQAMSAAQLREQLQQVATQQGWSQAQTEAAFREQMAQQASQQGFGQQMSEADMRERVNQVATQQGWSQAQAEAVFREQMAQQASSQGFQQALGAQGQQWQQGMAGSQYDWQRAQAESQTADERARAASTLGFGQALQGQQAAYGQGLQTQQWNQGQQQQWGTEQYQRQLALNQLMYGRDFSENQTNYERQQAQYRNQLAQYLLPWEQQNALAGYGAKATGQFGEEGAYVTRNIGSLLGQLGTAQGQGALSGANSWMNALTGVNKGVQGYLGNEAYEQGRQSVLSGLNR